MAEESADVTVVFYHLALRYLRIFPDSFDIVPLGRNAEKSVPLSGNVISKTCMGLIGDGGVWGTELITFLRSKPAIDIYESHGLRSAQG